MVYRTYSEASAASNKTSLERKSTIALMITAIASFATFILSAATFLVVTFIK